MQKHRFNPISFMFGLLFMFVGSAFLIGPDEMGDNIGWIAAGLPVVVGFALVWTAIAEIANRPRGNQ